MGVALLLHENNASEDGTHLEDKAMHVAGYLVITNFSASSEWIIRFRRRCFVACGNPTSDSRNVDQETREVTDCRKKLVVMASLTYVMLLSPTHISIYSLAKPQFLLLCRNEI
jgi:hypothetical protein